MVWCTEIVNPAFKNVYSVTIEKDKEEEEEEEDVEEKEKWR